MIVASWHMTRRTAEARAAKLERLKTAAVVDGSVDARRRLEQYRVPVTAPLTVRKEPHRFFKWAVGF